MSCSAPSGASCWSSEKRRRYRRPTPFSPSERSRHAALALSLLAGVGAVRFKDLIATFGSPLQAWDGIPRSAARDAAGERAADALERAAAVGARLIVRSDDEYPSRLAELPDPPPVLFAIGGLLQ